MSLLHRLVLLALAAGVLALAGLAVWLAGVRFVRSLRSAHDRRLDARYRPLVEDAVAGGSVEPLLRAPQRHRHVITRLLLAPLASVTGEIVEHTRAVATSLGLTRIWLAQTLDRRWWRRAEAAHALGLVGAQDALNRLGVLLTDPHETVRSAAVNALGLIADPAAVPLLLRCAAEADRYPHVRVMHSLRRFGSAVTPAAVNLAREDAAYLATALHVVTCCGGPEAIDPILEWTTHERADVRASAWSAIAAIGPDDRAYYHARRAVFDDDGAVRDAAAKAIQRSGRAA